MADPPRPDALLIGTGPPMLMHGLALAEAGARIVFLDAADRVGGSWRTLPLFGHATVEPGVHIIENRAWLNRTLADLLPDLRPSRDDFGLVGRRRIPMRVTRPLLYGLVAGKSAIGGKREKALHSLANLGRALRGLGVPLAYPAGGAAAMIAALEARLAGAGATIRLATPVGAVRVGDDGIEADTPKGTVSAARLVMSSRAHAPIAGLEAAWRPVETKTTESLVLLVAGPPDFAGYVEVIGDPLVKRVRNVTAFARPAVPPGSAILSVQLRSAAGPGAESAARERLVALGLVPPELRILAAAADRVTLRTLPAASLRLIERRFGDRVTALRTVDLGDERRDLPPPRR